MKKRLSSLLLRFRQPKWRHGKLGALLVAGFLAICVLVNVFVQALEDEYGWRTDLSLSLIHFLRRWWSLNDGAAGTDPCVPRLVSNLGLTQQGFSCRTQGAGQPGHDGLSRHRSSSAT